MKMHFIFSLITSLLLIYSAGCNSDVNPVYPFKQNAQDSYTWKSQSFSQKEIGGIFQFSGISEKDVWAAADNGTLHYDGSSWSLLPKSTLNGPFGICALGRSDVWSSTHGENGYVDMLHFDGSSWNLFGRYKDSSYWCEVKYITASGQNSLYAVGSKSKTRKDTSAIIMRYDGTGWSFVRIPRVSREFYHISRDISGKYYIGAQVNAVSLMQTGAELVNVFEFDGIGIKELPGSAGKMPLNINGHIYFTDDTHKLYAYSNGSFNPIKDYSYGSYHIIPVAGKGPDDIFLCAYPPSNKSAESNSYLLHYNGKDFSVILSFRGMMKFTAVGYDIFAAIQKNDNSFVLMHGRRK